MTTPFEMQQKSPVHTEMNEEGNFRIVAFDKVGDWAGYNLIGTQRVLSLLASLFTQLTSYGL